MYTGHSKGAGLVDPTILCDLDAEGAALGAALIDPGAAVALLATGIQPCHFYSRAHANVLTAIQNCVAKHNTADVVLVGTQLRDLGLLNETGGLGYLTELQNSTPALANVNHYAGIVKTKWLHREVLGLARKVVAQGTQEPLDPDAILAGFQALIGQGVTSNGPQHWQCYLDQVASAAATALQTGVSAAYSTGFPSLDAVMGGLYPGDLTVIAAATGKGKSAAALNLCLNIAKQGLGCLFYGLEMPSEQQAARAVANHAGLNLSRLRLGKVTRQDVDRTKLTAGVLGKLPIWLDDSSALDINQLVARAQAWVNTLAASKIKAGLVVVDYIQLASGGKVAQQAGRAREVGAVAQGCKNMAMQLKVPVVALSQFNRQANQAESPGQAPGMPGLHMLKESSGVEQAADNVIFLLPGEGAEAAAEQNAPIPVVFFVAKSRNGASGVAVELLFETQYSRFKEPC